MTRLALIVSAALLAGCAQPQQPQQWHWYKDGGDQAQFERDHGECTAQAFAGTGASLLRSAIIQNGCLRGKGWQQVPG